MTRPSSHPDDEIEGEAQAVPPAAARSEPPDPDTEFLSDVTQIYLHEIGLNPLLSPEEELDMRVAPSTEILRRGRK